MTCISALFTSRLSFSPGALVSSVRLPPKKHGFGLPLSSALRRNCMFSYQKNHVSKSSSCQIVLEVLQLFNGTKAIELPGANWSRTYVAQTHIPPYDTYTHPTKKQIYLIIYLSICKYTNIAYMTMYDSPPGSRLRRGEGVCITW